MKVPPIAIDLEDAFALLVDLSPSAPFKSSLWADATTPIAIVTAPKFCVAD
jgi:hypothetical protein